MIWALHPLKLDADRTQEFTQLLGSDWDQYLSPVKRNLFKLKAISLPYEKNIRIFLPYFRADLVSQGSVRHCLSTYRRISNVHRVRYSILMENPLFATHTFIDIRGPDGEIIIPFETFSEAEAAGCSQFEYHKDYRQFENCTVTHDSTPFNPIGYPKPSFWEAYRDLFSTEEPNVCRRVSEIEPSRRDWGNRYLKYYSPEAAFSQATQRLQEKIEQELGSDTDDAWLELIESRFPNWVAQAFSARKAEVKIELLRDLTEGYFDQEIEEIFASELLFHNYLKSVLGWDQSPHRLVGTDHFLPNGEEWKHLVIDWNPEEPLESLRNKIEASVTRLKPFYYPQVDKDPKVR